MTQIESQIINEEKNENQLVTTKTRTFVECPFVPTQLVAEYASPVSELKKGCSTWGVVGNIGAKRPPHVVSVCSKSHDTGRNGLARDLQA